MSHFLRVDPSKDWEHYGRNSPYFGVLSDSRLFGQTEIDNATKASFFETGYLHVDRCLATLADHFAYVPAGKAMDFGCGVGRLTNALSHRFNTVVGYDISQSMIEVARENGKKMGADNITYECTASGFSPDEGEFDFVHSYIVLQHIPVDDGMKLIDHILGTLRPGGVGALHITYSHSGRRFIETAKALTKEFRLLRSLYNVLHLRKPGQALMQMNCYDPAAIFALFGQHGIDRFFCDRIDDWGNLGLFLFFEKGHRSKSKWSNPATQYSTPSQTGSLAGC